MIQRLHLTDFLQLDCEIISHILYMNNQYQCHMRKHGRVTRYSTGEPTIICSDAGKFSCLLLGFRSRGQCKGHMPTFQISGSLLTSFHLRHERVPKQNHRRPLSQRHHLNTTIKLIYHKLCIHVVKLKQLSKY